MRSFIVVLVAGIFLVGSFGVVFAAPDLTVSITKVKIKDKDDGQKLIVKVEVCNEGDSQAAGPFVVALRLSQDAVLDGNDPLLQVKEMNAIAAGECFAGTSSERKFKVSRLSGVIGLHAIVTVDDEPDVVEESNESNNTMVEHIAARVARAPRVMVADTALTLSVFDGKAPFDQLALFNFSQNPGFELGEIHYSRDFSKAIILVRKGFIGPKTGIPSSGVLVVDVESLEIEDTVVLESLKTGNATRLVHAYDDPDGKHLWLNNDGPTGDDAENGDDPDGVFRLNVDPNDPDYLKWSEIVTGNGHHKSAFSFPTEHAPNARLLFATSNISDRTMSVIDNDPSSSTFLEIVKTVPGINPPGNPNMIGVDIVPHGMDYSEYSGKFYNGATSPLTCAVTVVDTTQEDLPVSCIPAGSGPGQIPAAGYVHIAHEGKTVYTVGSKDGLEEGDPGTGWLSAIDATDNDKVIAVIELGDVSVGSIDENGKKAYLPSSNRRAKTNVAAVVDIDPTSATYHQFLGDVTIGESGSHRNGEVTSDGKLAFYPNTCEECNTVSVINTKTDTEIAQLPVGSHATDVGIEGLHTPYK